MTLLKVDKSTESPRTLLRCHVDTVPGLDAIAVDLLRGSILDVLTLAYVAVSPGVRVERGLIDQDEKRRVWRGSQIVIANKDGRVSRRYPLSKGLEEARRDIHIVSFSYRNPIDAVAELGVAKSVAQAMSGFAGKLLLAGPQRRLLKATSEREEIANAVLDATLDVSVDERYAALESRELDNSIKREMLRQQKIKTETARLELALKVYKLQRRLGKNQMWTVEQTEELVDNVRVIRNVRLMKALGLTTTVESE